MVLSIVLPCLGYSIEYRWRAPFQTKHTSQNDILSKFYCSQGEIRTLTVSQRFLRPPSLPIPSCRRLSDFSASDGVTPAAATERKERIQGAGRHPEKYTLSDLRPNHQKSSRIFSHQGDQSELRGATPNFWPQSNNRASPMRKLFIQPSLTQE